MLASPFVMLYRSHEPAQTLLSFLSPASADENVGKARQRIGACEYAASLRLVIFLEAATNKHRGTPAAALKKR